jgi:hypothetical protein
MNPVLRKFTSFDDMKADEYRYWQGRPVHERMDAVEEINQTAFAIKGRELEPVVFRLTCFASSTERQKQALAIE